MVSVGVRELKDRLSEYLRMVRRGEEILVTDRGEPVAELRQPSNAPYTAAYPELERRARAGRVRLGAPNRPDLYPSLPPSLRPCLPAPHGGCSMKSAASSEHPCRVECRPGVAVPGVRGGPLRPLRGGDGNSRMGPDTCHMIREKNRADESLRAVRREEEEPQCAHPRVRGRRATRSRPRRRLVAISADRRGRPLPRSH